jgi:hypothetical protein
MDAMIAQTKALRWILLSILFLNCTAGATAAIAQENDFDWPRESIIVSDGRTLYEIDVNDPNVTIPLNCPRDEFMLPDHPVAIPDANWLWFDAIDQRPGQQQHRRLWRMNLYGKRDVNNLSSDPFGNSHDITPIPVPGNSHLLFQSNRTGAMQWTLTASGSQGPGFGDPLGSWDAAAWDVRTGGGLRVYLADYETLALYDVVTETYIREVSWGPMIPDAFNPVQLSVSPDGNSMVVSTRTRVFLKFLPDGELVELLGNGTEACFDASGERIAYVAIPDNERASEVYISRLLNRQLVDRQRLTYNLHDDHHPTWVQRNSGE